MPESISEYPYRNISYFKGLNSLRFIAAFLVVMHHSESMKAKNGIFSLNSLSLFYNGSIAVDFFFVLSGFLITFILLKERVKNNTISLKGFYLKRVIRIWPLYFLLVFLGTIVIPFFIHLAQIDYDIPYSFEQVWYYFLLFLPGIVTFSYGHHLLEPLWSIGVEEYFYLIWAPLLKGIKKNIFVLLLLSLAIMLILQMYSHFGSPHPLLKQFIVLFNFEGMIIGGLGAYFIFNRRNNISSSFLYHKLIRITIYTVLIIFILFHINISNPIWNTLFRTPIISDIFQKILFIYLIIDTSLVSNRSENKILSYLGKISYGIYMYHVTIIAVIILVLKKFNLESNPFWSNCLFYIVSTLGIFITAHLSKKYFENYFLQFRKKIN